MENEEHVEYISKKKELVLEYLRIVVEEYAIYKFLDALQKLNNENRNKNAD